MLLFTPKPVRSLVSRVLIACAPKSGSTFVSNVVRRYVDASETELFGYHYPAEQNLTGELLDGLFEDRYVLQLHMRPYPPNLKAIALRNIALVVLWRNIGDMLVSFDDHVLAGGSDNSYCYIFDPEHYRAMETQRRYQFLITYTTLSAYLAFYLSWRKMSARMHHYETMVADPQAFFVELMSGFTTEVDAERIAQLLAVPALETRLNVGIPGRSATAFSEETKALLEHRLREHPEADQLAVLVDDLPWKTPSWKLVRLPGEAAVYFVRGGRRSWIRNESWIQSRPFPEQRVISDIGPEEFASLDEGRPIA